MVFLRKVKWFVFETASHTAQASPKLCCQGSSVYYLCSDTIGVWHRARQPETAISEAHSVVFLHLITLPPLLDGLHTTNSF